MRHRPRVLWPQARLRAMEGKILKGEARGGLIEVTRRKEEQLARREQELQRRCAAEVFVLGSIPCSLPHTAPSPHTPLALCEAMWQTSKTQFKLIGFKAEVIQAHYAAPVLVCLPACLCMLDCVHLPSVCRRAEEAAAAAEIVRVEEQALAAGQRCSSLADQATEQTRKLERVWRKYQERREKKNPGCSNKCACGWCHSPPLCHTLDYPPAS